MRKIAGALLSVILIATISAATGFAQQTIEKAALDSMVSTERVFAATSLRIGIRASFLKFFADSAVAFSPAPYVFRQAVAHLPPPPQPLARTLRWEPVAGDVALSGDMGYLMGPSTMTETASPNAPTQYGFYLSVWQKQVDGSWKVAIDIGTDATEKILRFFGSGFIPLGHDGYHALTDSVDRRAACTELMEMDKLYSHIAEKKDVQTAYRTVLDAHAIAIRERIGPIDGRDTIIASVTINHGMRLLEPMHADVSHAADLGYTYGEYRITPADVKPLGYYVRIWKKNTAGEWKLVVEKDAPVGEK